MLTIKILKAVMDKINEFYCNMYNKVNHNKLVDFGRKGFAMFNKENNMKVLWTIWFIATWQLILWIASPNKKEN